MAKLKNKSHVDLNEWVDKVTSAYPPKVAKKRKKHMVVRGKEGDDDTAKQIIQSNVRTVPGSITQRGCAYAGCKGVVIAPYGDMVHITHGPVGCSYYSWMTRRNFYKPRTEDEHDYLNYCFTTDMQDPDVIFGGEKKLKAAIQEAYDLFKPKGMSLHATCPVGLIGDDVKAVAREMAAKLGIEIMGFACEGYKGVSQSAGHHIANNTLFAQMVDKELPEDTEVEGEYKINLLGEYNIGGDSWEIERVFEKMGVKVISTFSGDGHMDDIPKAQLADLNLVMCHRSINYLAEMMETRFGIPWIKVNFIGPESMTKALRKVAEYFDNPELTKKCEEVIAEELAEVEKETAEIKKRLEGKTAVLFVGGSRAHHYQHLLRDLGVETVAAGYEFAHRDDYEGRHVIPNIKMDADTRNIEEIEVEQCPTRYKDRIDPKRKEELKESGFLNSYDGMWADMFEGTLVIDDVSHHELDHILKDFHPDIVFSGVKDKYVIEKFGVPSKQLHSYDYSGPYAGYKGTINFARDIDMMINNPAWKLAKAPWDSEPTLTAQPNA